MNTKSIDKEVLEITKGRWEIRTDHSREAGTYPRSLIFSNGRLVANCYQPEGIVKHEEAERNTKAICKAINETYGKGFNPSVMEELYNVLIDALVGLESAKDKFELDTPMWGNTIISKVKEALKNAKITN